MSLYQRLINAHLCQIFIILSCFIKSLVRRNMDYYYNNLIECFSTFLLFCDTFSDANYLLHVLLRFLFEINAWLRYGTDLSLLL